MELRRVITVYGVDDRQAAWWDGLAARTAGELSGRAAPACVRAGMKGDPGRTSYGDLGPLQRYPLRVPARNAVSAPLPQALPAAAAPVTGSDLRSYVASFGL